MVIWITGLSGAGKTTLAKEIVNQLRKTKKNIIFLDGDELREIFGVNDRKEKNFSLEHRRRLAFQYANLCKILAQQNAIVVIATISLFNEIHMWNRSNLPNYFEVYLNVPINELQRRDPKGIYKKFSDGEIKNVAGLDLQVDVPKNPDYQLVFKSETKIKYYIDELMEKIYERLLA